MCRRKIFPQSWPRQGGHMRCDSQHGGESFWTQKLLRGCEHRVSPGVSLTSTRRATRSFYNPAKKFGATEIILQGHIERQVCHYEYPSQCIIISLTSTSCLLFIYACLLHNCRCQSCCSELHALVENCTLYMWRRHVNCCRTVFRTC